MTRSIAPVRIPDGSLRYCEYNGGSDHVHPWMYRTEEECSDHWRREDWLACTDPTHEHVPVIVGQYGCAWHATACLTCMCFIGPTSFFDQVMHGVPQGAYARAEEAAKQLYSATFGECGT